MTISSTVSRMDYLGTGSLATYSYTFKIFEDADLLVTKRDTNGGETTLLLDTDYTVTGAGDESGGTIVLSSNLTLNYALTIRRITSILQETDIRNQGEFFPESHENEFDKLTMIDQQQQDSIDRSIRLPETISADDFDPALPSDLADSAGSAMIVNDTGDGFIMGINTLGTDVSRVGKPGYAFNIPTVAPTPYTFFKYDGSSYIWGTPNGSATAKVADYIVLDTDNIYAVLMTTSSSNRTVTLPTAADNAGRILAIKKTDIGAGKCTIDGEGAETIDGALTFILSYKNDAVLLQCDGTGWFILAARFANAARVKVEIGNGHGGTNTKIRRFTTIVENTGSAITYADSSTLGASFTINEPGIYSMSYSDYKVGGSSTFGISLNSAQLTTAISTITNTDRLIVQDASTNLSNALSTTLRLAAGDVIRPHTDGTQDGTGVSNAFSIAKIGF